MSIRSTAVYDRLLTRSFAGPTGLLKVLAESFLDEHAPDHSVPWVCNHSRGTQLALFYDHVDVILVYERDQEKLSADEGWAQEMGIAFHDHFVVVGYVVGLGRTSKC